MGYIKFIFHRHVQKNIIIYKWPRVKKTEVVAL
jgi:hypothetical protein